MEEKNYSALAKSFMFLQYLISNKLITTENIKDEITGLNGLSYYLEFKVECTREESFSYIDRKLEFLENEGMLLITEDTLQFVYDKQKHVEPDILLETMLHYIARYLEMPLETIELLPYFDWEYNTVIEPCISQIEEQEIWNIIAIMLGYNGILPTE